LNLRLSRRGTDRSNDDFLVCTGGFLGPIFGSSSCLRLIRRSAETVPGDRRSRQRCIAAVWRQATTCKRGACQNQRNVFRHHQWRPFKPRATTYDRREPHSSQTHYLVNVKKLSNCSVSITSS